MILNSTTLSLDLITSIERSSKWFIDHPILNVLSKSSDVQINALYDCFALGRSDARVFISIRHLIKALKGEVLLLAIRLLAHVTPHPDILRGDDNWVTSEVSEEFRQNIDWDTEEITQMLSEVPGEHWIRGDIGQDVYMLLYEDTCIREKMEKVSIIAIDQGAEEVAFLALYLTVYWAGEDGIAQYQKMLSQRANLRTLPLSSELEVLLYDFGYVPMFD